MWFLLAVTIYAGSVLGTPDMSYIHSDSTMTFETKEACAIAETELRAIEKTDTSSVEVVLSCTYSSDLPANIAEAISNAS